MTSRELNRRYNKDGIKVTFNGYTMHNCERGVRQWIIEDTIEGYVDSVYHTLLGAEDIIETIINLRHCK